MGAIDRLFAAFTGGDKSPQEGRISVSSPFGKMTVVVSTRDGHLELALDGVDASKLEVSIPKRQRSGRAKLVIRISEKEAKK